MFACSTNRRRFGPVEPVGDPQAHAPFPVCGGSKADVLQGHQWGQGEVGVLPQGAVVQPNLVMVLVLTSFALGWSQVEGYDGENQN